MISSRSRNTKRVRSVGSSSRNAAVPKSRSSPRIGRNHVQRKALEDLAVRAETPGLGLAPLGGVDVEVAEDPGDGTQVCVRPAIDETGGRRLVEYPRGNRTHGLAGRRGGRIRRVRSPRHFSPREVFGTPLGLEGVQCFQQSGIWRPRARAAAGRRGGLRGPCWRSARRRDRG